MFVIATVFDDSFFFFFFVNATINGTSGALEEVSGIIEFMLAGDLRDLEDTVYNHKFESGVAESKQNNANDSALTNMSFFVSIKDEY